MTPPPTHVSNKPLPDFVYALPDNMAPQPSLTRFWCRGSVTRLTTASKTDPDGTITSFIAVFRRPEGYATRNNNFGVCSGCAQAHEGGCVEIEAHFRRACNILDWLIDRALHKHNDAVAAAGDTATDAEVLENTQTYFQTAYDYAKACRIGFKEYDAVVARKVKSSGKSEAQYRHDRQVSREHNLQRYNAAIGTVGEKTPSNVVVDSLVEEHFKKAGRAANAEKRWYYYGTDIPSATDAPVAAFGRLTVAGSPIKGGGRGGRRSPPYQISPAHPEEEL